MYGAVFMEAVRTFKHQVFRLEDHTERLERSMRYAGLEPLVGREQMAAVIDLPEDPEPLLPGQR